MKKKHKYKIGEIVFSKLYNQKYYGKVKKQMVLGSANENAYEVSGFGDPVLEKYLKKSTRKTIPH